MPQFWLEDFAPQIVWLAICFVVMYLLMWRVALPRVADVLEARQDRIATDLDKAEELKSKSEQVLAEYEAALTEARTKAQAIIAEKQAAMAAEAERRNQEVSDQLAERAREATAQIDSARAEAMAEVSGIARDLAGQMAEKLIGQAVPAADVSAAVDAAREG